MNKEMGFIIWSTKTESRQNIHPPPGPLCRLVLPNINISKRLFTAIKNTLKCRAEKLVHKHCQRLQSREPDIMVITFTPRNILQVVTEQQLLDLPALNEYLHF